jgi:hypothetical protein
MESVTVLFLFGSGLRKKIIPRDCAGFGFVYKAHPAAPIEIRVGGCNTADETKDRQDVELFFLEPLRAKAVAGSLKINLL